MADNPIKKSRDEVTPELLRELLTYNAETGEFFWKPRGPEMFDAKRFTRDRAANIWNTKNANRPAFTIIGSDGYLYAGIFGMKFAAHRVGWAMFYGNWPDITDHINHIRTDNRIENLRSVSHEENHRNYHYSTQSRSGRVGVVWNKRTGKWIARIGVGKRLTRTLGEYRDIADAIAAREKAEVEYGYHPNHRQICNQNFGSG